MSFFLFLFHAPCKAPKVNYKQWETWKVFAILHTASYKSWHIVSNSVFIIVVLSLFTLGLKLNFENTVKVNSLHKHIAVKHCANDEGFL